VFGDLLYVLLYNVVFEFLFTIEIFVSLICEGVINKLTLNEPLTLLPNWKKIILDILPKFLLICIVGIVVLLIFKFFYSDGPHIPGLSLVHCRISTTPYSSILTEYPYPASPVLVTL